MAQDTTPAIICYQGTGSQTVFPVPFDKGYYGDVKVLFVRRGLADYTYYPSEDNYTVSGRLYAWQYGATKVYTHTPNPAVGAPTYNAEDVEQADTVAAIAGQTITVDSTTYTRATQHDISNNLLLTWNGDILEVGDFICIIRDTERGQPYIFPNNQKHIEGALDNIERQVQEVKDGLDNALKIDPSHNLLDSHKMNPIDWLKSIIRCMDFSVRALRYANGWLDYSLDDPNIADGDKTWTHLLNTDNIKAIRERSDIVDGVTIYWTEYQASDGTWRTLANTSEWESRIQYAVDTAEDAKDVADDAKGIAQDAKDIADTFDGRLTQAEQDASDAKQDAGDAKDIAQDASDAVSAHIADTNNPHSVTAAQTGALPNTTKYGANLSLTVDSTTYVVTAQLKDQDGNNLGTAQTIDLPLESVVVSGSYDSATKEVVLTLQGGSTIRFSVADLVSGLQTEITALNMLSADLVDDTNTTHKFVTTTEKSTWNGKQDSISDLATIRSNAQAGKAAGDTIATYGDIVTHDVAEFATAAQGAKADTALQAGDNVSELVNDAGYLVMGDLTNFVTKNTAQTISGLKTFSADIVLSGTTSIKNTTSGVSYTMMYRDTSGIHVGTSTQALLLAGSGTRPKFNNNDIAMLSDIPTAVSQLTNDTGFITNAVNDLQNYTLTSDLATVATSGSYNDLSDKPTIPTTLAGLTGDVSISSPSDGEHLVYDAVANKWKNTPSSATVSWGGITGTLSDQTDLQDALDAKVNTTDLTALLNAIYPVGSVYIGTQSTCPMSVVISGSTWELVSSGRALWTGNGTNANTTIAAGLPNITGGYGLVCNGSDSSTTRWYAYGAMYQETTATRSVGSSGAAATAHGLAFAASRSSSVYGNSSTVQPPAYVVNVWRRTA